MEIVIALVAVLIGFIIGRVLPRERPLGDLRVDRSDPTCEPYGIASVADLYDLAGITCRSYTANKYGWTDIRSAKVVRIRDGYILQLPRTVQIN